MSGCSRAEQRFQNCYGQKPMKLSGVFLEKTPPFTEAKTASEFWNRSKTLDGERGDRRFNSGQPVHGFDSGCAFAGVAERQCTSFVTRTMPVRFRPPAPRRKRGFMTSAMTMPVLVLNASYEPVNITRARRRQRLTRSTTAAHQLAPGGGFEPKPSAVPKTAVLPLDDPGVFSFPSA